MSSGNHVRVIFTPLHPTLYIFALKHRLWVLVEAVLTCTHNQCFEHKKEKYHNFSSENYRFYSREISLYIAWECLRNVHRCNHRLSSVSLYLYGDSE